MNIIPFISFQLPLTNSAPLYAVCPLCTIAVGAGLGISRSLGIDDLITSLWIGALLVSSGLWVADWLGKKKVRLPQRKLLAIAAFFLLTVPFLYFTGTIGITGNTVFGIDKVLFGTALGSALFTGAVRADVFIRQKNHGQVIIYYQKVLLPLLLLSVASFIFYLILG